MFYLAKRWKVGERLKESSVAHWEQLFKWPLSPTLKQNSDSEHACFLLLLFFEQAYLLSQILSLLSVTYFWLLSCCEKIFKMLHRVHSFYLCHHIMWF